MSTRCNSRKIQVPVNSRRVRRYVEELSAQVTGRRLCKIGLEEASWGRYDTWIVHFADVELIQIIACCYRAGFRAWQPDHIWKKFDSVSVNHYLCDCKSLRKVHTVQEPLLPLGGWQLCDYSLIRVNSNNGEKTPIRGIRVLMTGSRGNWIGRAATVVHLNWIFRELELIAPRFYSGFISLSVRRIRDLCLFLEFIYATLPRTQRGQPIVLGGDPKGKNFLYTNGNSVIIRNIEVIYCWSFCSFSFARECSGTVDRLTEQGVSTCSTRCGFIQFLIFLWGKWN